MPVLHCNAHDTHATHCKLRNTAVQVKPPPMPKAKYVTPYNRLVGAVMVTQTRRKPQMCQVSNDYVKNYVDAADTSCRDAVSLCRSRERVSGNALIEAAYVSLRNLCLTPCTSLCTSLGLISKKSLRPACTLCANVCFNS